MRAAPLVLAAVALLAGCSAFISGPAGACRETAAWTSPLAGPHRWWPGYELGGILIATGRDPGSQRVAAFDARDGSLLWQQEIQGGIHPTAVHIRLDETFLLPVEILGEGWMIAFDARSGRELWRASDVWVALQFEGSVILNGEDGLRSVEPRTGTQRWSYTESQAHYAERAGDLLVVHTQTASLAFRPDGAIVWVGPEGHETVVGDLMITLHAPTYVTGKDDRLVAVDPQLVAVRAKDRAELWRAPAASDGYHLYLRDGDDLLWYDEDGRLGLLDARTGSSSWSSRIEPWATRVQIEDEDARSSGREWSVTNYAPDVELFGDRVIALSGERTWGAEDRVDQATLRALSAKDGTTLWTRDTDAGRFAATSETVLVAERENAVLLDAGDGAERWRCAWSGPSLWSANDEAIYFAADGMMMRIDL